VGTALHHNPVPLVIPCHRVVRSDGSTGGYAFGAAAKVRLLRAEGVALPD
jgi:O-6-methylguanine DNA methyltransferase